MPVFSLMHPAKSIEEKKEDFFFGHQSFINFVAQIAGKESEKLFSTPFLTLGK